MEALIGRHRCGGPCGMRQLPSLLGWLCLRWHSFGNLPPAGILSVIEIFRQLPYIGLLVRVLFGKMFVVVLFHLDEDFVTAAVRP